MLLVKKLALGAFIAGCAGMISNPSHAFMMDAPETASIGSVDMTQTVDQLRKELKAGEIKCEEMLSKIDAAIEAIDSSLDNGVVDETKYLGLRDELVELRLELPCLADELAQTDTVINEEVISEVVIPDGTMLGAPVGGGFIPGGTSGGGGAGGGSGGGGGIGGLGLLALGGIAAAIAIPIATGDNDDPGTPASPSK